MVICVTLNPTNVIPTHVWMEVNALIILLSFHVSVQKVT